MEEKKSNAYIIPGSIIIAGLLIAGTILYTNSPFGKGVAAIVTSPQAGGNNQAPQRNIDMAKLADNDPVLGNPNAPVTIIEFGDFQCPFCGQFAQTTEKEIVEKYIKTGKVKLIYRDFPLSQIHPMAEKAAEAGECAHEQDQFWPYHDILYARQKLLSDKNLKDWAKELKLNAARFNECLDSGKYRSEIEKDLTDGQEAGVNGTPTSFLNGQMLPGALPFSQFQSLIESELKKTAK